VERALARGWLASNPVLGLTAFLTNLPRMGKWEVVNQQQSQQPVFL